MAKAHRTNLDPLGGPARLIADDRPCPRCSYNLKGLPTGGRCPECGATIRDRARTGGDLSLNEVTLEFLKRMRLGSLLMLVGGPGGIVSLSLLLIVGGGHDHLILCLAAAGFLAWATGVFILHERHPSPSAKTGRGAGGWWRLSNRLLGAAPLAAVGALAAALAPAMPLGPPTFWLWTAGAAGLMAIAGFWSICYYLSFVCVWLGDDATADQFRIAGFVSVLGGGFFGIVFLGLLSMMLNVWGRAGIFSLAGMVVAGVLTLRCIWGGLDAFWTLHHLFRWAIRNRFDSMDADVRIADRIRRRIEENQSDASRKKARHINNP